MPAISSAHSTRPTGTVFSLRPLDPGEEVTDDFIHLLNVRQHRRFLLGQGLIGQMQTEHQAREGGAQLVGDPGQQQGPLLMQTMQIVGHAGDRLFELLDFTRCLMTDRVVTQFAAQDARRGCGKTGQRAIDLAHDQPGPARQ